MADINLDTSDFEEGLNKLGRKMADVQMKALKVIADELLRLSQLEVPFKTGHLLQTGNTEPELDYYIVGYNTHYAAKMHEHPEYHFRNGRKGKYLEDPMKRNLPIFREFFNDKMGEVYA